MTSHTSKSKKIFWIFLSVLAAVCLTFTVNSVVSAQPAAVPENQEAVPGRYIITMRNDLISTADAKDGTRSLIKLFGGTVVHEYQFAIDGFSANLPPVALEVLLRNPNIQSIQPERVIRLDPREKGRIEGDQSINAVLTTLDFSANSVQNLSSYSGALWGLDRIDQNDLPLNNYYGYNNTGSNVHVYVIDTGILPTHNEFESRASADYVVPGYGDVIDCDGHGTHVAGTIGGVNVGVAKEVFLHGVKVLDCDGNGTDGSVIAGVDYVIANHLSPAVINMSVGGGYSSSLNAAVQNAINAGITVVVAAGNEEDDACYYSPSSAPNAITVGGTEKNDRFIAYAWNSWFGSNYGTCVDINAPGYYVYSSVIGSNSSYATYSGTSMASPHVAGAAALYLQSNPTATPAQVSAALIAQAVDTNLQYLPAGTVDLMLNTQIDPTPIAVSPIGDIDVLRPEFVWNEFGGSSQYNLVVTQGASELINTNLTAADACSDGQCEFFPTSDLPAGDLAWKVRGYSGAGGLFAWTSFITPVEFNILSGMPIPISPEGLMTDTTPTFTWNAVSGATEYHLKLLNGVTEIYLETVDDDACTVNCSFTPATALDLNTDYEWMVEAYVGSLWGGYTSPLEFRVIELTPTGPLTASLNGTTTLSWEEVPEADSYDWQIRSGTSVVRSGTVGAAACSAGDCSVNMTNKLNSADYTWRFNASVGGFDSDFSADANLKVARVTLTAPSGSITDKTPDFTFNHIGASDYRINLLDGGVPLLSEDFSAATCASTCVFQLSSELGSGNYTWFVKANFAGVWSDPSDSLNFSAVILTPISPSGTTLDTRPIYTWEQVPGAAYYRYEVYKGTSLLFYRKVSAAVCGSESCQHDAATTLAAGAYSWRVRAQIGGVWTIYSDQLPFTVVALTPSSPKGVITTDMPVFTWNNLSGATRYELEVSGQPLVEVGSGSCGTNCAYQFPDPLADGSYTWRVRAELNGTWTNFTSPTAFTILKFTLLNPSGTTLDARPIYTWEQVPGAAYYRYEVYKGTTLKFYKVVSASAVCGADTCEHDAGTTLAAASYSWRLRAKIGEVWTIYSDKLLFTVAALTPSSPKGVITTDMPVFTWNNLSGATRYELEVSGQPLVEVGSGSCGTNCAYQFPDPLADGSYTWRVRAELNGTWTNFTSPTAFTILNFNLIAPQGTISDHTPAFSWGEISGATDYRYEVYKGTTLKFYKLVSASSVCSGGTCLHDPGVSLNSNSFKWRLRAKIGGVWTIYSDYLLFTIAP